MTLRPPLRSRSPLAFSVLALIALLAGLAALQYRWAGELSAAELARLKSSAEAQASGFARDFDREITRALIWFAQAPEPVRAGDWSGLAPAWARWHARAPYPALVRGVFALSLVSGRPETLALDPASGAVAPAPWPTELDQVHARLTAALQPSAAGRREGFFGPGAAVDDGALAIVVPVLSLEGEPAARPPGRPPEPRALGFVVALLDGDVIRKSVLPALEQRHFDAGTAPAYGIEVTGESGRVWASPDLATTREATPDASVRLFGASFEAANQDLVDGADPALLPFWRRVFGLDPGEGARRHAWNRAAHGEGWGRWSLALTSGSGGLAQVVAVSRRRNLAISFGILLLLGASVALLVQAARRAERLARQQVEFVAGVTHELRTPLAVIRSAGENLADGVIADAAQVRRYGELVRDEGRRLTELVEEALALAGAESGRGRPVPAPVALEALIAEAVRGCQDALAARGGTLDASVAPGLPDVMGDEAALVRALRNLLDNAIKYGGETPRIRVRAALAPGAAQALVTVEDQGPGIARDELASLFEPFYRGREALAGKARGSGLGLSLVKRIAEAHGGSVAVASEPGRGSAFTLSLPVRKEPAQNAAAVLPPADA